MYTEEINLIAVSMLHQAVYTFCQKLLEEIQFIFIWMFRWTTLKYIENKKMFDINSKYIIFN